MEQPSQIAEQDFSNPFILIYRSLFNHYGEQYWWPGETPFEVMVGAVLTQNTSWTNVEKAILNLKANEVYTPENVISLEESRLAELIRPSGYFNLKAKRLKNYCEWYVDSGGFDQLNKLSTESLRLGLLSVNGVGPETADDILLYAFDRSVFVIDAYTRRLFSRLELVDIKLDYEETRAIFEAKLDDNDGSYKEYHALIVKHGKDYCKPKPICTGCCLEKMCSYQ